MSGFDPSSSISVVVQAPPEIQITSTVVETVEDDEEDHGSPLGFRTGQGGECFVFDQRVALNHQLEPGVHSLCHACGLPLSPSDRAKPNYIKGVQCTYCVDRFSDADRARFSMRQKQFDLTTS